MQKGVATSFWTHLIKKSCYLLRRPLSNARPMPEADRLKRKFSQLLQALDSLILIGGKDAHR